MRRTSKAADNISNGFRVLEMAVRTAIVTARMEGRNEAFAQIRSIVAGGGSLAIGDPIRRGPGRPPGSKNKPKGVTKSGKPRKNSWAGLSPAERLARVNAIRKGKGLPPKTS